MMPPNAVVFSRAASSLWRYVTSSLTRQSYMVITCQTPPRCVPTDRPTGRGTRFFRDFDCIYSHRRDLTRNNRITRLTPKHTHTHAVKILLASQCIYRLDFRRLLLLLLLLLSIIYIYACARACVLMTAVVNRYNI